MTDAIFLSASVPDARRGPMYAATADAVAITAAVSALVHVTLGRRRLVWGGHPAITPMIHVVASAMDVDYGGWVTLYQSRHFQDEFPEDNAQFRNVVYTDDVKGDRDESLRIMRRQMFAENQFSAAVFIGGMRGIVDEFELFREAHSNARVVPVVSTGGAVLEVAQHWPTPPDLRDDRDYVMLLHRHLQVSPKEKRYRCPDEQPPKINDRLWEAPR